MGRGSDFVDLWPKHQKGDWRTAFFYVPEGSSVASVDKAKTFFAKRWFDWLLKEGYEAYGQVYFGGPYRSPDAAHLGDSMFLIATRFRRFKPIVIRRDAYEGSAAMQARHGELPANEPPGLLEYLTKLPRDEAERRIKAQ